MSTSTETISRPPRAPAASVLLTAAAIVVALVLAPVSTAAAAEPLPVGTYTVEVAAGDVVVTVPEDRRVELAASDGLLVELAFDELGRVLDEFTVRAGEETFLVDVDAAEDGSYTAAVEQADEQRPMEGAGGEVVQLVAACAPTGIVAAAVGLPNHGTIVSAAASGLGLGAEVTDPVTGTVTPVVADFSSVAGAEAFCALMDATVPSIEEVRAELAAQREETRSDRAAARAEREAVREASRHAHAAEREAAARLREAEREARAAERAAELQARRGNRDTPVDERGQRPPGRQDDAAPPTETEVREGVATGDAGRTGDTTDTTDSPREGDATGTDTTGHTDDSEGEGTPTEEVTEPTPGKSHGKGNSGGKGGGQGKGPTP